MQSEMPLSSVAASVRSDPDRVVKMKIAWLLSLILGAMNLPAGDILEELERHDKVVQHGVETLSFAEEVNSLFGTTNVDHFISSFGSKTHAPVWNSVTYFSGRYTLTLQVPISIDYENCRLSGVAGSPIVYVNEVTKVDISTSGGAGATLKGGIGELSESQWKKLVAHGGDWSVVNVPIFTNRPPIKNFEEYVRQAREPIRNRKEGFDNPIKQALQALRDRKASVPETNKDQQAANNRAGDHSNELDCYEKVVRHSVETLIFPKEVESLFGATNVDHFISKFGSKTQTPVWHSLTYFAGKYRLTLQVPISIDYEKCRLRGGMNSAMIQIDEITKVNISKSGLAGATTKGKWSLSQNEWKWLLKNKGDWSVVKVPMLTNAPVKGFDEYVRRERKRPVRDRQEDFDKPIRQAIDAIRYPFVGEAPKEERKSQ